MPEKNKLILITVGPSCAGKTSMTERLLTYYIYRLAPSHTTRPMREGETNGFPYYFITDEEFERMNSSNEFLQTTNVHGYKYGMARATINAILDEGLIPIVDLVSSSLPPYIEEFGRDKLFIVFIDAPLPLLFRRMTSRDGEADRERLRSGLVEKNYYHSHKDEFDVYFLNIYDDAKEAVDMLFKVFSAPQHMNRWINTL